MRKRVCWGCPREETAETAEMAVECREVMTNSLENVRKSTTLKFIISVEFYIGGKALPSQSFKVSRDFKAL